MKRNQPWLGLACAVGLGAGAGVGTLPGQDPAAMEKLEKQVKAMQERFDRTVRDQQQQIDALREQLKLAQDSATNASLAKGVAGTANAVAEGPTQPAAAKPWTPAEPIRVGTTQNYISLSLDALVAAGWSSAEDVEALQPGGHDPKQRGFTVQNLELTLDGKVDPYFRGQANLVLQIDPAGGTTLEAEEAYLETVALPWNLQVKAGHYFTEFGRLNATHPHTWDFVDQPLINGRLFGEDGLRNPGARVSWLAPTPFYSELFLGLQNSQGATAYSFRDGHDGADGFLFGRPAQETRVKGFGDMLYAPRYAASFDLTDQQTFHTYLARDSRAGCTGVVDRRRTRPLQHRWMGCWLL